MGLRLTNSIDAMERKGVMLFEQGSEFMDTAIIENQSAAQLLLKLMRLMDDENRAIVTREHLAQRLGKSVATIGRSMTYLMKRNAVLTSRVGGVTIIHVNSNIAWKGTNNKGRFAVFCTPLLKPA
ncbi:replication/maintenance protein RepL [Pandoraea communis]|uniref:replication/maintenance protein RepL n=1 Tax=Pandoraea communis TaxID=2508297 RepID=UPI003570E8CF